jgi:hypothetical protein
MIKHPVVFIFSSLVDQGREVSMAICSTTSDIQTNGDNSVEERILVYQLAPYSSLTRIFEIPKIDFI